MIFLMGLLIAFQGAVFAETDLVLPECPPGFDVTSPGREGRICRRLASMAYQDLAYGQSQLRGTLIPTYFEQLINQDPVTTTQLVTRIDKMITDVEVNGSITLLEADMMLMDPDDYRNAVFRNGPRGERYADVELTVPDFPEVLATRIPTFQQRGAEYVNATIVGAPRYPINFGSIVPSSTSGARAGYPTDSPASNEMLRCTTGGFFNRAQSPEILFNRCGSLGCNIAGDLGPSNAECNTPKRVRLSLDGKQVSFSCNPGGIQDANVNRAVNGQRMCDPLLYGFKPALIGSGERALSACHHPPSDKIGRFGSYTETIAGRIGANGIGTEHLHALPERQAMKMAQICPSMSCGPSGEAPRLESQCDRMARNEIDNNITVPDDLKPIKGSILLAAKLAMENARLWETKKRRHIEYCRDMKRNPEKDNCLTIGYRIQLIEDAIEKLKLYSPSTPRDETIPMVGTPVSESAG